MSSKDKKEEENVREAENLKDDFIKVKRSEYEELKTKWENVPENVKYLVERIGLPTRAVRRDLKDFTGVLLNIDFDIKSIELGCEEVNKSYTRNVEIYERKIVSIPFNNLIDIEFILETQEKELNKE